MFPIMLDLKDKHCVVIGGGKIAARKLTTLLRSGAQITVISPEICDEIKFLANEKKVIVFQRDVQYEDYQDAFLVIAATHSLEINSTVAANIGTNQLLNVVNKHELGNFHIPASFSRGKLQINVSTSGASPHLAKKIRNELMNKYDESYEAYVDFLYECRQSIKHIADLKIKASLLEELLDDKYRLSKEERQQFKNRNNL
ncbi:NAD(P)-binding protein [Litchfieldia salsa]|uniref:precorrin-2 dehydrogenase n=1 Tax=Litchfieldia salsa TaxID=930152 RepID=A0A1H0STV7_9BACI|nr:NAD(P)-binding protein [Litchfieldia salsa]SDP45171.1 precorrin-2 dehydrogenase [Litchfieldia salsa]